MVILYITGPMSGMVDLNYPAFMRAEELLRGHGFDVLNPARIDDMYPKVDGEPARGWSWYMRKSIPMVCEANGLALLPNWQLSAGSRVEHSVAKALGMKALCLESWLYAESPNA